MTPKILIVGWVLGGLLLEIMPLLLLGRELPAALMLHPTLAQSEAIQLAESVRTFANVAGYVVLAAVLWVMNRDQRRSYEALLAKKDETTDKQIKFYQDELAAVRSRLDNAMAKLVANCGIQQPAPGK